MQQELDESVHEAELEVKSFWVKNLQVTRKALHLRKMGCRFLISLEMCKILISLEAFKNWQALGVALCRKCLKASVLLSDL